VKKIFLLIIIIAIGIFSSMGCITKQMWRDQTVSNPYNETIMAFYTNPKSSELAFIGEQYHYIFNNKTEAFSILLNNKKFLNLKQSHLKVNAFIDRTDNRIVHTSIYVRYPIKGSNSQQMTWLEKHGFFKHDFPHSQSEKKIENYSKHYALQGIRYLSNKEVNQKALKLRTPIKITIDDYKTKEKSTLYKIAMTPISLTGDALGGVLMLGAVVVMSPIWLYERITQ